MSVHIPQSFATLLKASRISAGLTQDELALYAGISIRTVSDLERGLIRYPHADTVARLADALRLAPPDRARLSSSAQRPPVVRFRPLTPITPLPLIGRATELERLRALALRPDVRLLTLLGPAGVGKTRLAYELAMLAEAAFPDGVAFVTLDHLTQSPLVVTEIAQQLGIHEMGHQPIAMTLAEALSAVEALLVLDNFEQVTEAADSILALLARCPKLTVLVTSRFALNIAGEHQFRLTPLAVPPAAETDAVTIPQFAAVALFCACLQVAQPSPQDLVTIGQICRAVDGLPLGIRLVASLVPRYSLAELLTRSLATTEPIVSDLDDLPERQGSVMRAITWSYDLLATPLQRAFQCLSVCVGGATRAAAAALVDLPPAEELALFDALVSSSLISFSDEPPQPRYRMLTTMRAFAQRALAATAEAEAVAARHAHYFTNFVIQMGLVMNSPEQPRALAQLLADHDNIRAALAWAAEHDAAGDGLRMISILWRFWHINGFLTEGRRWSERMLAASGGAEPSLVGGQAYYGAAILANEQGDYATAKVLADAALAIFRPLDYALGIAAVANLAGSIARYAGDFSQAAAHFTEAQSIYETLSNRAGIALTLNNLGTVAIERGEYGQAQHYFERSLAIKREGTDPRAIALTLNNLGDALQYQSDYAAAEACYRESEALFETIADRQGMSMTLMNRSDLARYTFHLTEALEGYDRARIALEEMGDRQGMALIQLKRAQALLAMGDFGAALHALRQSLHSYESEQNATQLARCFDVLAMARAAEGDHPTAVQLLALAEQLRRNAGTLLIPAERASVSHWIAELQLSLGDAAYLRHWQTGMLLDVPLLVATTLATLPSDSNAL